MHRSCTNHSHHKQIIKQIANFFCSFLVLQGPPEPRIDTSQGEERVARAWREAAVQAAASVGRLIQLNRPKFWSPHGLFLCDSRLQARHPRASGLSGPGGSPPRWAAPRSRRSAHALWPCLKFLTPQFCCVAGSTRI